MFERFTDDARRVVLLAQHQARDLGHDHVGPGHLLLGILGEEDGIAARALHALGADQQGIRQEIEAAPTGDVPGRPTTAGHVPFAPEAKRVLELSLREALQLGHNYIGSQHILLGLLREGDNLAVRTLARTGIEADTVREEVHSLIRSGASEEPRRRPAPSTDAELLRSIADRLETIQAALERIERRLGRDDD